MDSGNSGSIQSSSGGDEEYDSRAESISAFLSNNNNPLTHLGPMPNPPPPQPAPDHRHHHHPSMFDPLSNYFDPLSSSRSPPLTNQNSLLNLDMVWSKTLRSDTNCTDLGNFIASSSSSPTQPFFTNQPQTRPTFPPTQIPHGPEASTRGSSDQASTTTTSMVRNPKKRSRASRRAPTTVLTTDTTNFRAMVQEFTGIPAPPFTSSPFPRSRLDLFGTSASSFRSAAHHLTEPPLPPYLLRPFAQKIQPPPSLPFLSSSSSSSSASTSLFISSSCSSTVGDAIASSTTTTNINSGIGIDTTSCSNSSSTSINYQLSSDRHLGLLKSNILNINMQNPILNLHSLLQLPPKYPHVDQPIISTTKPQQESSPSLDLRSNDTHLKMGVFEEFGLDQSHCNTNLTGLQSIISSSEATLRRSDNNWVDSDEGHQHHDQGLLRSVDSDYNNSQRVNSNGRVNFSASSSDFHGDKGQENVAVATRSEGMVESWICSRD